MNSRENMIRNLQQSVVPILRNLNFKGSFPHFRRLFPNNVNLLTFQFDRNGGGFVIEIANAKNQNFITYWGKEITPKNLTAHDIHVDKRKRIQADMEKMNSTEGWFRYDRKTLFQVENIYQEICKDLISKLAIAEEYWENN